MGSRWVLVWALTVGIGCGVVLGCGGGHAEPPADPFACIDGWPTEAAAAISPSLAVAPSVIWTQPLEDGESPASLQQHVLTLAGSAVVLALDQGTVAFDRATGQRLWKAQPVTQQFNTSFSQPALAADLGGNTYGVARDTYSLDVTGRVRWQTATSFSIGEGELQTVTRFPPLLSPDGLLFVRDADSVRALATSDGSEVWHQTTAAPALAGAGPVLVLDSDVRRAADGQLLGQVRASDGTRLHVWGIAGLGFLGWHGDPEILEAVSPCDQVMWSLAADFSTHLYAEVVGPLGVAYVSSWTKPSTASTSGEHKLMAIAPGGTVLATRTTPGVLMAIGADGTVYLPDCSTQPIEIVALGDRLGESWRLPIEGTCPEDVLLGDGGLLYLLTRQDPGYRIVAVQTTSPGLAPTGWPTPGHDARSTRWLGP